MCCSQLAQEQIYQTYALKKAGVKNIEIASILHLHKSTIYREVKRNSGGKGYRPKQAHNLGESRKKTRVCLSHEWIYQHIRTDTQDGGSLHTHLRCRKRRKRYGASSTRGHIDRISIDERPQIVETR